MKKTTLKKSSTPIENVLGNSLLFQNLDALKSASRYRKAIRADAIAHAHGVSAILSRSQVARKGTLRISDIQLVASEDYPGSARAQIRFLKDSLRVALFDTQKIKISTEITKWNAQIKNAEKRIADTIIRPEQEHAKALLAQLRKDPALRGSVLKEIKQKRQSALELSRETENPFMKGLFMKNFRFWSRLIQRLETN